MRLWQGPALEQRKMPPRWKPPWVKCGEALVLTREGAEQYSHMDFTRTSPAPTRPQSAERANWARPLGQPFARWGRGPGIEAVYSGHGSLQLPFCLRLPS